MALGSGSEVAAAGLLLTAAAANLVGALLATRLPGGAVLWVAFATGFLLAAVLLDMFPASLAGNANAPLLALTGYLGLHVLESKARHHGLLAAGFDERQRPAAAAIIGLMLHAAVAGAAIVAGTRIGGPLGISIAAAISFHKVPEGAAVAALLLSRGHRRSRALAAGLAVGAATLLGGLATLALPGWSDQVLPIATGVTLYVAASQLLPDLIHDIRPRDSVALLAGAVIHALSSHWLHQPPLA